MAKNLFIMKKSGGALGFCGECWKKIYASFVAGLKDGQVMTMELKKKRNMKTNPQLGYWHAVILKHAHPGFIEAGHASMRSSEAFGRRRDYATTEEDVDEFLKDEYAECNKLERLDKKEMTDEQMSAFIDWTLNWLAEWIHVVCPPPTERTPNDQ